MLFIMQYCLYYSITFIPINQNLIIEETVHSLIHLESIILRVLFHTVPITTYLLNCQITRIDLLLFITILAISLYTLFVLKMILFINLVSDIKQPVNPYFITFHQTTMPCNAQYSIY